MSTLWVMIRSWHIVGKGGFTRCGRQFWTSNRSAFDTPQPEKCCETCLRLVEHDQEKAMP